MTVDDRGIFFFFRLSKQQWFIRNALVDMSLTASVANLLAVAVERHQTIITMQVKKRLTTLTDSKAFSFKLVWLFFSYLMCLYLFLSFYSICISF